MHMHLSGLSNSFMQFVPALEQAMVEHGYNPSDFSITRTLALNQPRYRGFCSSYSYTVTVDGRTFTVVLSGDADGGDTNFLSYFYNICLAPEEKDHPLERKLVNMFARVEHWLVEDPLNKKHSD